MKGIIRIGDKTTGGGLVMDGSKKNEVCRYWCSA